MDDYVNSVLTSYKKVTLAFILFIKSLKQTPKLIEKLKISFSSGVFNLSFLHSRMPITGKQLPDYILTSLLSRLRKMGTHSDQSFTTTIQAGNKNKKFLPLTIINRRIRICAVSAASSFQSLLVGIFRISNRVRTLFKAVVLKLF